MLSADLLVESAAKATIVLVMAWAVARLCLDRSSAAVRSRSTAFLTGVQAALDRADQANWGPDAAERLTGEELARRLAAFLWGGAPDAELETLAARGRLADQAELERQTQRSDALAQFHMPAVRATVADAAAGNYRWSSLVAGIVKSTPFQMRRLR